MIEITEIKKALSPEIIYLKDTNFNGISIDSRTVKKGDLFFAIQGDKFDGHDFIDEVIKKEASGIVIDRIPNNFINKITTLKVNNTKDALIELARFHRNIFSGKMIAITGSNGKTTTKELIYNILKYIDNTLKTEGNLNNELGVSLTLLRLEHKHKFAVIEMGCNKAGEISFLTKLAKPDYGLITTVNEAHLEGLKSVEGVAKAKGELFEELDSDGISIINIDNQYIRNLKTKGRTVTFGKQSEADLRLLKYNKLKNNEGWELNFDFQCTNFDTKLSMNAPHHIDNALAAASAAWIMGAKIDNIQNGLKNASSLPGRMNIIKLNENKFLIDDCYNANPASMKAAINYIKTWEDLNKVAILGEMKELGSYSIEKHKEIGKYITDVNISLLITVGHDAQHIGNEAISNGFDKNKWFHYSDVQKLIENFKNKFDSVIILVKGSHSVHLENFVSHLLKKDN